jgi:chromosome segregation ATPase
MTLKQKLDIAAAALLILLTGLLIGTLRSHLELRRLDREIEAANQTAAAKQTEASQFQLQADELRTRSQFLEGRLNELQTLATKQDEQLKTLDTTLNSARNDVDRTRRIRTAATTAADLCRKLAELGHGCR